MQVQVARFEWEAGLLSKAFSGSDIANVACHLEPV